MANLKVRTTFEEFPTSTGRRMLRVRASLDAHDGPNASIA
jgi:hypothetical protein